jgi:hypothetical protein
LVEDAVVGTVVVGETFAFGHHVVGVAMVAEMVDEFVVVAMVELLDEEGAAESPVVVLVLVPDPDPDPDPVEDGIADLPRQDLVLQEDEAVGVTAAPQYAVVVSVVKTMTRMFVNWIR